MIEDFCDSFVCDCVRPSWGVCYIYVWWSAKPKDWIMLSLETVNLLACLYARFYSCVVFLLVCFWHWSGFLLCWQCSIFMYQQTCWCYFEALLESPAFRSFSFFRYAFQAKFWRRERQRHTQRTQKRERGLGCIVQNVAVDIFGGEKDLCDHVVSVYINSFCLPIFFPPESKQEWGLFILYGAHFLAV